MRRFWFRLCWHIIIWTKFSSGVPDVDWSRMMSYTTLTRKAQRFSLLYNISTIAGGNMVSNLMGLLIGLPLWKRYFSIQFGGGGLIGCWGSGEFWDGPHWIDKHLHCIAPPWLHGDTVSPVNRVSLSDWPQTIPTLSRKISVSKNAPKQKSHNDIKGPNRGAETQFDFYLKNYQIIWISSVTIPWMQC